MKKNDGNKENTTDYILNGVYEYDICFWANLMKCEAWIFSQVTGGAKSAQFYFTIETMVSIEKYHVKCDSLARVEVMLILFSLPTVMEYTYPAQCSYMLTVYLNFVCI